jgi:N-methylhydantoinase A
VSEAAAPRYRIGIDIGGTFTDAVLVDDATGATWTDKVPTTIPDRSLAFADLIDRLATTAGIAPATDLGMVVHATTTTTNTLLERAGATVALLTTEGFRDVLEVARQIRWELYNLQTNKPAPLIPRERCYGIPGRLDHAGREVRPLDEDAVIAALDDARAQGATSIALCFIHAYANPVHEQRAAALIRSHAPELQLSVSSELAPEIREYWRASTTVVNAYVAPVVGGYLDRVTERLEERGVRAPFYVMGSSGGVMTAEAVRQRPVYTVESGPAAGVAASLQVAQRLAIRDAITFDMGGTTAKVGLILGGRARVLREFEVGSHQGSGSGVQKASGYPILGSVVDLVEVGAGGGSIGWIDSGGHPRVGPRSAGADPGPASYGWGGSAPTVTDANLVLGRLGAASFLGGRMPLDADAAERAIEAEYARPLGVPLATAAQTMLDLADATMSQALRLVSIQRGYDPREFALIAFGGGGPLHALHLAEGLGIRRVIVPPDPGVLSAHGLLATDLRREFRRTRVVPLTEDCRGVIRDTFDGMTRDADGALAAEGVPPERRRIGSLVDARYQGQVWTLAIDVPPGDLDAAALAAVRASFDERHRAAYGYEIAGNPVEIVHFTVEATGVIPRVPAPPLRARPRSAAVSRPIQFGRDGFVESLVVDRAELGQGDRIDGPAAIEGLDSTVVVRPGWTAMIDGLGNVLLDARDQLPESPPT